MVTEEPPEGEHGGTTRKPREKGAAKRKWLSIPARMSVGDVQWRREGKGRRLSGE